MFFHDGVCLQLPSPAALLVEELLQLLAGDLASDQPLPELHHLLDFWKAIALDRIRKILRAGGVLRLSDIVYSFEPSEPAARIEQWCATLPVETPEGEWVRADIEEHVRDEHSTYTWLLEAMLERSGFRIDTADYSPDGFFADYVARVV